MRVSLNWLKEYLDITASPLIIVLLGILLLGGMLAGRMQSA